MENDETSVIEEKVRNAVRAAGYKVPKVKMAVLFHHPNPNYNVLPITPDLVLVKHKIAIEVDPLGDTQRYFSHRGKEKEVVESSGFTKDAQAALCEAIEDKIANRRAKVRVVKKGCPGPPAAGCR